MDQDTSPEQGRRYHAHLRGLPMARRAEMLAGLCGGVRLLAEAGIRLRHPGVSDEELRVRLAVRLYGRSTAERVFGAIPPDAV